jgi:hypothetical protein
MCAAISPATGSADRNFNAATSDRATPSYASGAHARENAAPAAGQPRPRCPGSPQRAQTRAGSHGNARVQSPHSRSDARPSGARHATQAGGTMSPTISDQTTPPPWPR